MDPNTALVFETIGLIKKSLQCSICLDILNDPHSTRCNHQFCSRCIRKVVDERKDKKQEALCPLCKNPITKRSLTSNPRLNEIVDVVRRLNEAFQEDAGIPDSPYPLVNSKLNGQSYLQFCDLNPTPLKPVLFKCPKSCGDIAAEQKPDRSVNHSSEQLAHNNASQQRRSTGFEILSLLESETNNEAEPPAKCTDEKKDKPLQENYQSADRPATGEVHETVHSQTAKSQENVGTADTKSSGSLTIDPGKISQSSVNSGNSVSMLVGLLSQESRDEAKIQNKTIKEVDVEAVDAEENAVNKDIVKPEQDNNDATPPRNSDCSNASLTCNLVGNSDEMLNNFQNSPNDQHEFKRTQDVAWSRSKPSPSCLSINRSSTVSATTPNFVKSNSVQNSVSIKSKGNSAERTCDQYSRERVSASIDSDDPHLYQVIPLPQYEKYSDNEISLEFPIRSDSVSLGREKDYSTGEVNGVEISSQDELCSSSELKCNLIQTEKSQVGPEYCDDSEKPVVSPKQSESHISRQESKRKRNAENDNDFSFQKSCSPCFLSGAKEKNSCDEIIHPTAEDISSQDELCLPLEKSQDGETIRAEQSEIMPCVDSIPNSQNFKNSEASVIPTSPSENSFLKQKSKRKRSVGDNCSLKKYARLSNDSNDSNVSKTSIVKDKEPYDHGEVRRHSEKSQNKANYTVKKLEDLETNNIENDQQNVSIPSHRKAGSIDDSEDDIIPAGSIDDSEDGIIPPTPPVLMDVECASHNKSSRIESLNHSKSSRSEIVTDRRTRAYKRKVVDKHCFGDEESIDEEILWPRRSRKLAKAKKHKGEDDFSGEDEDNGGNGGTSQNGTRRKESVCENERIDDLFKEDEEGELMVVSDGGRSPIMDDDRMYSSQEDFNVAVLRKLAPASASHKESETESEDETSDHKNTDTTSVSSLTDADGVEVSTQRIRYLHEVLAETGGEIEKLTKDLKSLKESDVKAQTNKMKHNHIDEFNNDDGRVNGNASCKKGEKDRDLNKENACENQSDEDVHVQSKKLKHNLGGDFHEDNGRVVGDIDPFSVKEDEKDCNLDKESNIGDQSDEDVHAQSKKLKHNHGDNIQKKNGMRVRDIDPFSDKEDDKDHDSDNESNIGDSDEDVHVLSKKIQHNHGDNILKKNGMRVRDIDPFSDKEDEKDHDSDKESNIGDESDEDVHVLSKKIQHNHCDNFHKENGMRVRDIDPFSDKEDEKDRDSDKESNIGDSDEDVIANLNKLKHNHGVDFKNNIMRVDDNDSFSDEEKKGNVRVSDEDLISENENENSETSDAENNILNIKGIMDSDRHRQNKNNSDGNGVDEEQRESDREDNLKEKNYEIEVNDDSCSSIDNDDGTVDVLKHCTLSPPPALDPSTLKLTKLPPAIKNLKKMLQQNVDTEDEHSIANFPSSVPDNSHLLETLHVLQKVFGKNRTKNSRDMKEIGLNNQLHDACKARDSLYSTDTSTDNQKNESKHEGSQKENSAKLKRRSLSRDFSTQKTHDNSKQGRNVKKNFGPPNGVLTEQRANTGPKQRTLTTMLGNGLNHEASCAGNSSLCFVITRLPKQFVSLAGYLAKQNGGSMCSDVNEETTHIIMPTDSKMQASRKNYTIKYLLGIALGKWIVSQLWITACVKSGRLVDETQYEVKGDVEAAQSHVPHLARTTRENKGPLLFDSISVVCFGEFNAAITRDQVCHLVRYCGGNIIDFGNEFLKATSEMTDLVLICDSKLSKKTELQIKDLCERYNAFPVSVEWITDSIANYQLQDIEEYRMDI